MISDAIRLRYGARMSSAAAVCFVRGEVENRDVRRGAGAAPEVRPLDTACQRGRLARRRRNRWPWYGAHRQSCSSLKASRR